MPHSAKYVTNTILQRAFREGRTDMSPMKMQKMLFFTHGWHLATTGMPAIDRPFEVWRYGPVVSEVYQALKGFGSDPITSYIKEPDGKTAFVVNPEFRDIYTSLDIAWEKYVGIPAVNLSAMTHEPGSPWDVARRSGASIIADDLIRGYFVRLAG